MSKYINKIIIIFISFILWFIFSTNFAIAYIDEGPILWASGTNVMQRSYSDITGELNTPSVAISGVNAKFITLKASPVKKEFILGIQDTSGNLRVYHSSNGTSWTFDWTVAIGDGNVKRFDITFENLTGRAIVAYRGRILTLRTTFYYRIWNGTAWTSQTEMRSTVSSYTGNIVSMQLASRSGSNQVGMVYTDDKYYAVAAFWSGSAWTFAPSAVTTNGSRYTGFTGTYPPLRNTSVAFETSAGDMLVVAGHNTADKLHYLVRTAAGVWGTVSVFNPLSGYGDYSELVPSPTTNDIALTSCTMNPSTPSYICDFVMWNGSSFGTVSSDITTGPIVDGDTPTGAFWLSNVSTRLTAAVFDDSDTTGIDYQMSSYSGTFYPMASDSSSPSITTHEGQILSLPLDGFASNALVSISDSNNNVYMKKASINGISIDWSSITGGNVAEITQGNNLVNSNNFETVGFAMQRFPQALVIATTSANTIKSIAAGTKEYLYSSDCTDETTCSAFTIDARGANSFSVPRIVFTNTGTINLANTSGWELVIDNDINPNNGVQSTYSGTISGNTIVFYPYQYIASGQRLYAYLGATFGGNSYPTAGDTITLGISATSDIDVTSATTTEKYIVNSPVVKGIISPIITGYTNITETSLSNTTGVACVNCGGRIGAGSFAQQIQINGTGFGTATGTISIKGASATQISASNIISWSNTQIRFILDSSVVGNTDSDFGSNYGGPSALSVIVSNATSSALDFYLFPQITGVVSPSSLSPDGAKEYSSLDTDGIITVLGTRLGSNASSSILTILGCSQTTCSSPTDSVYTTAWSNTGITARVPTVIPDNLYSGNIKIVRNYPVGASSSADIYQNTFYIRGRVLSITPSSGDADSDITITGNHLCQPLGVCPLGSLGNDSNINSSPGFSVLDRITIGGDVSTYWGSWSDTSIQTKVPSSSNSGATSVTATAGGYFAGSLPFTVTFSVLANAPTNLTQFAGASSTISIPTGGYSTSTSVRFGGVISVDVTGTSSARFAVEVLPVGSPFVCGSSACVSEYSGAWVQNISSLDCNVIANGCSVNVPLPNDAYHFRARTELLSKGIIYYSPWVSYPTPVPNLETVADFWLDNGSPTISNLNHGTPGTNSISISWDTNEKADTLVQINKTGDFTDSCVASDGCTGFSAAFVLTRTVLIKNLSTNTNYFYRVRSRDNAMNTTWSSVVPFKTLAISKPSKTIYLHVISRGGLLSENASSSQNFSVKIPESDPEFKSVYIDLRGMYATSGVEPVAGITVSVNGESPVMYSFPGGSNIISPWRLYHKVSNLNIDPSSNTITITASPDTQLSGISGNIITTYTYKP